MLVIQDQKLLSLLSLHPNVNLQTMFLEVCVSGSQTSLKKTFNSLPEYIILFVKVL